MLRAMIEKSCFRNLFFHHIFNFLPTVTRIDFGQTQISFYRKNIWRHTGLVDKSDELRNADNGLVGNELIEIRHYTEN